MARATDMAGAASRSARRWGARSVREEGRSAGAVPRSAGEEGRSAGAALVRRPEEARCDVRRVRGQRRDGAVVPGTIDEVELVGQPVGVGSSVGVERSAGDPWSVWSGRRGALVCGCGRLGIAGSAVRWLPAAAGDRRACRGAYGARWRERRSRGPATGASVVGMTHLAAWPLSAANDGRPRGLPGSPRWPAPHLAARVGLGCRPGRGTWRSGAQGRRCSECRAERCVGRRVEQRGVWCIGSIGW